MLLQYLTRPRTGTVNPDDPTKPQPEVDEFGIPRGARMDTRTVRMVDYDPNNRDAAFQGALNGDANIVRYTPEVHTPYDWEAALGPVEKAMREARIESRREAVQAAQQEARRRMQVHTMQNLGADILQGISGVQIDRPDGRAGAMEARAIAEQMGAEARGLARTEEAQAAFDSELRRINEELGTKEKNRQREANMYNADLAAAGQIWDVVQSNREAQRFNQAADRAEGIERADRERQQQRDAEDDRRAKEAERLRREQLAFQKARSAADMALRQAQEARLRAAANAASNAAASAPRFDLARVDEAIYGLEQAIATTTDAGKKASLQKDLANLEFERIDAMQNGAFSSWQRPVRYTLREAQRLIGQAAALRDDPTKDFSDADFAEAVAEISAAIED